MKPTLDSTDSKLIYLLDFNARMPLTQLAKKLHVSKQVALYRLEQLQRKSIIQGFYTDINASKLGYAIYLVYLKFQNLTPLKQTELIAQFAQQQGIGVNASLNGSWDHCIGIWAKSPVEFEKTYKTCIGGYEQFIKHKNIMVETGFHYFKPKQIFQERTDDELIMQGEEAEKIDDIDEFLLTELSKNARTPLTVLGTRLRISPNTIKARIRNLERHKIILAHRVMINYPLLKFLHLRVFLHLGNEARTSNIISFLKYEQSTVSVTRTIGYCELEFRCVVKDIQEFYQLIEKLRTKFLEITEYESILYYEFHQSLNYFPFTKQPNSKQVRQSLFVT